MAKSEAAFQEFLTLLYNAATAPNLWPDVLERLADLVGAQSAWMSKHDVRRDIGSGLVARMDEGVQAQYFDYFIGLDPFRRQSPGPPSISNDELFIPKHELVATEFYNDFMRPLEAHSILMLGLQADDARIASIHLNRPEGQGRFATDDLRVAALLHPHLMRAAHIAHKLEEADMRAETMSGALDHSPDAVMLLDASGFVLHANRKAEALLAQHVGLRIVNGRLEATVPATSSRLGKLIGDAAAKSGLERRGGLMLLAPSRGKLPLSLTAAPLDQDVAALPIARARVVVTISDPNVIRRPHGQTLADLFGLTPAETRVALLLGEGLAPREAADRLGVTFNTIRNQLKSIYEKTDVKRQSELVALLHRLATMR